MRRRGMRSPEGSMSFFEISLGLDNDGSNDIGTAKEAKETLQGLNVILGLVVSFRFSCDF